MPRTTSFLFIVLAVLGLAAPAQAAQKPVGTIAAGLCQEQSVEVPVDRARLQAELPEGWQVRNSFVFAQPSVFVVVSSCSKLSAGGVLLERAHGAQLTTGAVPPRGPAIGYVLRDLTDHPGADRLLRRAGFAGGQAAISTTATGSRLVGHPLRTGTVDAGADSFGVTVSAFAPDTAVPGISSEGFTLGTQGPAGLAQYAIRYRNQFVNVGAGRVTAPAGSYLARLLGATEATGFGTFTSHGLEVDVSAERPGA